MSLAEWIDSREMTGFTTFTFQDVRVAFPHFSQLYISKELYRFGQKKRIQTVYKGFYAVVPMQFRDRGVVPPYNYIGQLMAFLGRPYYISLLSAGVLNGAAHQRPQRTSIMTALPKITLSPSLNCDLQWYFRREIPSDLLLETKSDTGIILYSCPELTAADLVQYSSQAGGLSTAATVIAELVENTDFVRCGQQLLSTAKLSTLQRLGYILDVILDEQEQADAVASVIASSKQTLNYRPLSLDLPTDGAPRNKRWRVIENTTIEPDDIW